MLRCCCLTIFTILPSRKITVIREQSPNKIDTVAGTVLQSVSRSTRDRLVSDVNTFSARGGDSELLLRAYVGKSGPDSTPFRSPGSHTCQCNARVRKPPGLEAVSRVKRPKRRQQERLENVGQFSRFLQGALVRQSYPIYSGRF
jgi:hypothetical protein